MSLVRYMMLHGPNKEHKHCIVHIRRQGCIEMSISNFKLCKCNLNGNGITRWYASSVVPDFMIDIFLLKQGSFIFRILVITVNLILVSFIVFILNVSSIASSPVLVSSLKSFTSPNNKLPCEPPGIKCRCWLPPLTITLWRWMLGGGGGERVFPLLAQIPVHCGNRQLSARIPEAYMYT